MKKSIAIVVLLTLAIGACESGPTQEEKDAAAKEAEQAKQLKQEAMAAANLAVDCRRQVGGLIRALRNTGSRLDVGLTFADYSNQVGQISIAYDRIPFGRLDFACTGGPGIKAEKAFNEYTKAYNAWNDCVGDLYCDMDSIDPELQKRWQEAGRQTAQARASLSALEVKAVQARARADQQKKKADEAEAALET